MSKKPNIPGVDFVVTADQIAAVDLEGCLADSTSVGYHDIHKLLKQAFCNGTDETKPVFHIFMSLTDYHFVPTDRVNPYKPIMVMKNKRALIPSDILPEQIDALAKVVPSLTNHGLRARISDVVWHCQRSKWPDLGFLAVESYCDAVEAIESKSAVFSDNAKSPLDFPVVQYIERACVIAHTMGGWEKSEFKRLSEIIKRLVGASFDNQDARAFLRISRIALDRIVCTPEEIARMTEKLASTKAMQDDPFCRQDLWKLAAKVHHHAGSQIDYNRCMGEVAECMAQNAELATDSSMRRASFLQDAIACLREIPNTRDRRRELDDALREAQSKISDEMGKISHEVDLNEFVENAIAAVTGSSLSDAILMLFCCCCAPNPTKLRAVIKENDGISSMIPTEVHDKQGRLVFKTSGYGSDSEANEEILRLQIAQYRDFSRLIDVNGTINPIRWQIIKEHMVPEDALLELFRKTPFVPAGHEAIFARGAMHFIGGQDLEAASLLIPQLENSLRHILSLNGIDTTKSDNNGIQTEASLTKLINDDEYREQLEKIMPPEVVHEIDMLFTFKGSSALRNHIAHAKYTYDAHWGHNVIWGSWFVINIAIQYMLHVAQTK